MKLIQLISLAVNRRKSKQAAYDSEKGAITVAETLIALGIGATVIGVVFAGIPAMINARNATTGLNGLLQISTVVRNTYGIRNTYAGLNTELAIDFAGFPPHFIINNGARHPWGGAIVVSSTGDNDERFMIQFSDMPEEGCVQIAASSQDTAEILTIDNSEIGVDSAPNDPDNDELTTITGLCEEGDKDVAWTFGG